MCKKKSVCFGPWSITPSNTHRFCGAFKDASYAIQMFCSESENCSSFLLWFESTDVRRVLALLRLFSNVMTLHWHKVKISKINVSTIDASFRYQLYFIQCGYIFCYIESWYICVLMSWCGKDVAPFLRQVGVASSLHWPIDIWIYSWYIHYVLHGYLAYMWKLEFNHNKEQI